MRRSIALAVVLLAIACGGDSPVNPASASIAGTYKLSTINGSSLPFTYQSGMDKAVITADVLTVADGGTWTEQGAITLTANGQTSSQVVADGGTWTRAGTTVAFFSTSRNTTSYTGTFTGSGLTLSDQLFTYVFAK